MFGCFFRMAAAGLLPASWFRAPLPDGKTRKAVRSFPSLEIVSHCWRYSHMLSYQLSSFINYPPEKLKAVVSVFFAEEDGETRELLDFISRHNVPNISWNWRPLPKNQLFRRSIGRNQAAFSTRADWIWMTDCDIVFHKDCLDSLADQLCGRNDILLFPRQENRTTMLENTCRMLQNGRALQLVDIDTSAFNPHTLDRAKGEYQIIHGDVARAIGYCDGISLYQTPARRWCKCHEDRVFRWLAGTRGTPVDVAGVYQIRHIDKGRYRNGSIWSGIRSRIRRMQE